MSIKKITAVYLFCMGILFPFTTTAQDTMQIHLNSGFHAHENAKIGLFGSLINDDHLTSTNQQIEGQLYLVSNSNQLLGGDSSILVDTLVVKNSNGVEVQLELMVASEVQFEAGNLETNRVDSSTEFVHFLDNASYSGESDNKHVNGTVRKTGDDAFIFPIGNGNYIQPIAISSPAQQNDHFTAFYRQENASSIGYSTSSIDSNCGGSPVVVDVSENEYWNLERTGGNSNVEVTLYYDNHSSVNTPSELVVMSWNGSEWQSHGNGGTTGTNLDGTVISGTGCGTSGTASTVSIFGPFTLGGTSATAVPVELILFEVAKYNNTKSLLTWATASEIENSHFVIEQSHDGIQFSELGIVQGAGYSNQIINYSFIDHQPEEGINYYRLKQVDFSGAYEYTEIRSLLFENGSGLVTAYPNPAREHVTVDVSTISQRGEALQLEVYNQLGALISSTNVPESANKFNLDLTGWNSGIYHIRINNQTIKIIKN